MRASLDFLIKRQYDSPQTQRESLIHKDICSIDCPSAIARLMRTSPYFAAYSKNTPVSGVLLHMRMCSPRHLQYLYLPIFRNFYYPVVQRQWW